MLCGEKLPQFIGFGAVESLLTIAEHLMTRPSISSLRRFLAKESRANISMLAGNRLLLNTLQAIAILDDPMPLRGSLTSTFGRLLMVAAVVVKNFYADYALNHPRKSSDIKYHDKWGSTSLKHFHDFVEDEFPEIRGDINDWQKTGGFFPNNKKVRLAPNFDQSDI